MGVVPVVENESSNISVETNNQNKPKSCEQDRCTAFNDPIVSPMKENNKESCDADVTPMIENIGLSREVETDIPCRSRLKCDIKPNGMPTPDEKSIALEERKLAYEERKLAIQEKKMAIEEKKLQLESRKIALLKEKQNISNNLVNHCDQSDDAESERTRPNVFDVLMSFKQHSVVTSTTESNVVKEKPKEVEDVDAKIKSRKLKQIVKVRLEELADKKLSKNKRSTEGDCLKGESTSKKKRLLLLSQSDEEGSSQEEVNDAKGENPPKKTRLVLLSESDEGSAHGEVNDVKGETSSKKRLLLLSESEEGSAQGEVNDVKGENQSKKKRLLLLSESEEGSAQGEVDAVDVIVPDDCDGRSSRASESKSPASVSRKHAKKKRLLLMLDEESADEMLEVKSVEATTSRKRLSLKQTKLNLKPESDILSSPPPNDKKRNSLFNYFNVSKKDVTATPEKTDGLTNNESSPTDTEQKPVDANVVTMRAGKSRLKIPLELELTDKQLVNKLKNTNQSGCRRSPRKKESTPTKLDLKIKDSTSSSREKVITKSKSPKKPWQMRIKPVSSTPAMDLFTKVLSDNEDMVIDDDSDSDGPIFDTKKTRQKTTTSKTDTNEAPSKEARSPTVAKKSTSKRDTNKAPPKGKEASSPIVAKKGTSRRDKNKTPPKDKEASSPIVAKKSTSRRDTNKAPPKEKEVSSPIVAKKSTSRRDTNKAPPKEKEAICPTGAKKTRLRSNQRKSSKADSCLTPELTSEDEEDKSERKRSKKAHSRSTTEASDSKSKKPEERRAVDKSRKTKDTLDDDVQIVETKVRTQTSKAPVKLAPLFMKKQPTPKEIKPMVDPSILEARQRFLNSGVPDCVKKITEIIFRDEPEDTIFPAVGTSHVTQQDSSEVWNLPESDLKLSPYVDPEFSVYNKCIPVGSFIDNKATGSSVLNRPSRPGPIDLASCRTLVKSLKLEFPEFPYPMYRMFKVLRDKNVKSHSQRSEPSSCADGNQKKKGKRKRIISDSDEETKTGDAVSDNRFQMWTEKYKPLSGDEVIGNRNCVKQLKLWLESWKKFRNCDNPKTLGRKKKRSNSSSEDEFINDSSDDDDNENMPGNTAILYGPHGCGKTSIVYALANELGFEVLESNASTKRTGKCLLAEFQGATQIHRLCAKSEQTGDIGKFLKSGKSKKKTVRKAKPVEKDDAANSKMSIVLIDDADIVFEDHDEGFVAALATLVTTSRRPIIFVANQSESHLDRFYEGSLVLDLARPDPGHTSVWLQLICLLEGVRASNRALRRLLMLCNGDVGRTLLQLQVWALSGGNNLPPGDVSNGAPFVATPDEDSDSSCGDTADCGAIPVHEECIETFVEPRPFPAGLWWNLAPLLSMPGIKPRRPTVVKQSEASETPRELYEQLQEEFRGSEEEDSPRKAPVVSARVSEAPIASVESGAKCTHREMQAVTLLMDSLSAMDVLTTNPRLNADRYEVGPCQRVWERAPVDGVDPRENLRPCWSRDEFVSQSVVHFVTEGSVELCRRALEADGATATDTRYDPVLPTEENVRWRYDQQAADNTIVNLVALNQLPDHRAIFTDYIPTLQSICSHETRRFERNTTRANRFFHYLRGLGIHAADGTLSILASSFRDGLWQVGD